MWHILNAETLYCYNELQPEVVLAPEFVQCHIKLLAQRTMSSLEHGILGEIVSLSSDAVGNTADGPIIWSTIWAMILLYRGCLEQCQHHNVAGDTRDNCK